MRQAYYFPRRTFRKNKQALISAANTIINEYRQAGLVLTLRQLYYQFVSRDLIPNNLQSYKTLGEAISDGRLNGDIDWDAIEDRTRNLRSNGHWESPQSIMDAVAAQYAIDKWADQPKRVEVWVEKEALSGVFDRAVRELDVPLMACKGYMSQSEIRSAGVRMKYNHRGDQKTVVLHFGDHDPSGIDMTRDITERLCMFAEHTVVVERLALNFDQIEQYTPPPNPAKQTDSRFESYAAEYGNESWELDALEPRVLDTLVRTAVLRHRNERLWDAAVARETEEKDGLQVVALHWDEAVAAAREAEE